MGSLQEEAVKLGVLELDGSGLLAREIAQTYGIGKSTVTDFLRKETYQLWHLENDAKKVGTTENKQEKVVSEEGVFRIETTPHNPTDTREKTHLVIPDTQCKPDIDMAYLSWLGEYIVERKPDVIVNLGDHADMPSLSSYDKGKKRAEGKRVNKDIEAAIEGMRFLLKPLHKYQEALKTSGGAPYKPTMILVMGNHESRIERHVEANPELSGLLSYDNLKYKEFGWEVHDFLKPVIVDGVSYVHYMANPMTGRPYGGTAMNVLKNVGESFTMGHKQTLDVATRFLPASGRQQWAVIAGAYYAHSEDYKGHQGNHHWRGVIVKHNVRDGSYNPMFVDIDYLRRKYNKE